MFTKYKILLVDASKQSCRDLIGFKSTNKEVIEIVAIGLNIISRKIQLDKKEIEVQLWISDNQTFRSLISESYYRGIHGIIYCCEGEDPQGINFIKSMVQGDNRIAPYASKLVIELQSKIELGSKKTSMKFALDLHIPVVASHPDTPAPIQKAFRNMLKQIKSKLDSQIHQVPMEPLNFFYCFSASATCLNLDSKEIVVGNGAQIGKFVKDVDKIKELVLSNTNIGPKDIEQMPALKLNKLCLTTNKLGDVGAKHLKKMQITELMIGDNQLTSHGVYFISQIKTLRVLDLSLNKIAAYGLLNLNKLSLLSELKLNATKISIDEINALSTIKSLLILSLTNCGLTDEMAPYLVKLNQLCSLCIAANNISCIGMQSIAVMHNLRNLNISNITLRDAGISHILQMKITHLNVSDCKLTDPGAEELSNMRALTHLIATDNHISIHGAQALSTSYSLLHVNLDRNNFSSMPLDLILALQKNVNLRNCPTETAAVMLAVTICQGARQPCNNFFLLPPEIILIILTFALKNTREFCSLQRMLNLVYANIVKSKPGHFFWNSKWNGRRIFREGPGTSKDQAECLKPNNHTLQAV